MMQKPKYTEETEYKILEQIATSAGIKIKYTEVPEGLACYLKGENTIIMSKDDIYEFAPFALAHEISHCLIEHFYDFKMIDYTLNETINYFLEADADKIASVLTHLAIRIANNIDRQ